MSIGYKSLEEGDFEALAAAGRRWAALASRLAEQVESLEDTLNRRLCDEHWAGEASEAARERLRAVVAELEGRIDPAAAAAAAIADAASSFSECQADLAELLAEGADPDDPDPETEARLAAIVARAAEVDQELAARIRLLAETDVGLRPLGPAADPAGELADLLTAGAAPRAVNAWWDSLSGPERDALVEARPDLVGRADGLPTSARDEANRRLLVAQTQNLDAEISRIREQLSHFDGDRAEVLRDRLEILTDARSDLAFLAGRIDTPDRVTGQEHYLLGFDTSGDGRAVIALGDPDVADNTAVFVPGTGAALGNPGDLNRVAAMAHDAHEAAPTEETAFVTWLGYDAPDNPILDSPSLSYAKGGSADLASFMAGLEAANRDPELATTTVIGYSYGTTVVGHAAKEHGLATDQVIAVASPGMNVANAAELGLEPGNVWASTAPGDIIRIPGAVDVPLPNGDRLGLGPSPVDDDFGARVFASDPMSWNPIDIHTNYWDEGNAARDNMAFIVTGQTDRVR